ncbi:MAG TPA: hypothetical protein VL463_29980 [Kofleriaceae bacterium]|nr:hypothetical protein [Kofleriaceae bacterium]
MITDIAGFALAPAPFWPMDIGAGQPRVMERIDGTFSRYEIAWTADDRLAEVRTSLEPGRVRWRDVYVWNGARIDRIRHFDEATDEAPDQPEHERVFTYDVGDRPAGTHMLRKFSKQREPIETWQWSDGGRTVHVIESAKGSTLTEKTARFDAADRLSHVEKVRAFDGARTTIDLEWSPDGRLLVAREHSGAELATERVVRFRWNDAGQLVSQSSPDDPSIELWAYRYDEGA